MIVYGKYECFVMQILYVRVLCAPVAFSNASMQEGPY